MGDENLLWFVPILLKKGSKTLKMRMGQKTLEPYYKYIVKDSPKTLFSIFSQSYHTLFSIIPIFFHDIPTVCVDLALHLFVSIPWFDN